MALSLEHRLAILDLESRYCHFVDEGDGDGYSKLFAEDGVLDLGGTRFEGRAALKAFADGVPAMGSNLRHVFANPVVDGDGGTATVRAYQFVYETAGDAPPLTTSIRTAVRTYDELRLEDGQWRIALRTVTFDGRA